MSMSDPIADMLTRIRNAGKARFSSVDIPGSKLKTELAKVLKDEGFIKNYKFVKDDKQGILRIYLKYGPHGERILNKLTRISKPGRKVYRNAKELSKMKVLDGLGTAIISTSQGIMTDRSCRKLNLGGEVMGHVW